MTELQKVKYNLKEANKKCETLDNIIKKLEDENQALAHDRYMAESHYEAEKKKVERLEQEKLEWQKMAYNIMGVVVKLKADVHFKDVELAKEQKWVNNDEKQMPF